MYLPKLSPHIPSFLFCYLICISLPVPSLAHGGGTDAQGGHYNHRTGSYHYHHGYGPHAHSNGICQLQGDATVPLRVAHQSSSIDWGEFLKGMAYLLGILGIPLEIQFVQFLWAAFGRRKRGRKPPEL